MTATQALLLGIVQGATEYLPISSSGHLVLVPWLLGWHIDPQIVFPFNVLVQWGTTLAVIIYFWGDLKGMVLSALGCLIRGHPFHEPQARLAWLLVIASLPAAVIGLLLKEMVEAAFTKPWAVSLFLLFTAVLLTLGERFGRRTRQVSDLGWIDSLWIGLAQTLSLFPGVSRSGATIAGGMSRCLQRPAAARFSFLMAVPVMIGAGVVALFDLAALPNVWEQVLPMAIGFAAASVIGYLAIAWLLSYLSRQPLTIFIAYCTAVGIGGLLLSVLRG